jgi:hypothetical protein
LRGCAQAPTLKLLPFPPSRDPPPSAGDSPQRAAALVQEQLDRLAALGPTPAELARIKKAARMELLAALQSNSGLASALVTYEVRRRARRGMGAPHGDAARGAGQQGGACFSKQTRGPV